MTKCNIPKEVVEEKVNNALNTLLEKDKFILDNNTNERSITHKLGEYLQTQFPDFHVDCEYNREADHIKEYPISPESIMSNDREGKTVFPDVIIHERKIPDRNLLIIEVKKSSNMTNREKDREKVKAFTKDPKYKYDYGLFLIIGVGEIAGDNEIEWFRSE